MWLEGHEIVLGPCFSRHQSLLFLSSNFTFRGIIYTYIHTCTHICACFAYISIFAPCVCWVLEEDRRRHQTPEAETDEPPQRWIFCKSSRCFNCGAISEVLPPPCIFFFFFLGETGSHLVRSGIQRWSSPYSWRITMNIGCSYICISKMEMTSMLYYTIYAVQRINPRALWMPGNVVAWRNNHHYFHGNYQNDGRTGRGEWPGEGREVPRRTLLWSPGSCLCFDFCLVWLFFQPLRQGPWCVLELLPSTSLDAHVTEGASRRDRTGVIPTVPCLMLVHSARTPINL